MSLFQVLELNRSRGSLSAWESSRAAFGLEGAELQGGAQTYWGIPFELGDRPILAPTTWLELPMDRSAAFIVLAHCCDPLPADGVAEATSSIGEVVGEYRVRFADGEASHQVLRRRFEIAAPLMGGFSLPFAARPSRSDSVVADAEGGTPREAGFLRSGIVHGAFTNRREPLWWLYAIPNPRPEAAISSLDVRSEGHHQILIGGITLYTGTHHPLRHEPARLVRVPLEHRMPPSVPRISVDLGIVGRRIAVDPTPPDVWLGEPFEAWSGRGDSTGLSEVRAFMDERCLVAQDLPVESLVLEVTATPDATLEVDGRMTRLADLEVVAHRKAWVHGRVVDADTGRPTAARIHFRTLDGLYLPPYGHHQDVDTAWFQDEAAELKLGPIQSAYVQGDFRLEVPGDSVLVEVHKGFEYQPERMRIAVSDDRPFDIPIHRAFDSGEGWMTADTHVHFLSPHTALLEAEAEDVDLVNLLAAQWGHLFTNVGDLGWGEAVRRGDRSVWMGSENRQNVLGHISMLGTGEHPVHPFSSSGPMEAGLGDPTWLSMADWADRCRERGGLVVSPHFSIPYGEVAADLALAKIDAVELRTFGPSASIPEVAVWYTHLNAGLRVPCVGGTDKMWATMPIGDIRTYAFIGDQERGFPAFAEAVRAGKTVATTGPFITLTVEGKGLGEQLDLPAGGGHASVAARVRSSVPTGPLELVVNGRVVARTDGDELTEDVHIDQGSWIAARVLGPALFRCNGWPSGIGAHTSPIYVTVGGVGPRDTDAIDELSRVVDGGLVWLDTLATRASDVAHENVRTVFLRAQDRLEEMRR